MGLEVHSVKAESPVAVEKGRVKVAIPVALHQGCCSVAVEDRRVGADLDGQVVVLDSLDVVGLLKTYVGFGL